MGEPVRPPTLKGNLDIDRGIESTSLDEMSVQDLFAKSVPDRKQWYMDKLGLYRSQLDESARKNKIPVQLLAAVILNELADINWIDTWQQKLIPLSGGPSGSFGIAQIQVSTAISHKLVDYDRKDLPLLYHGYQKDDLIKKIVARRLATPQFAIEAAAREIKKLIEQMADPANRGNPWQQRFAFTLDAAKWTGPEDLYNAIGKPTDPPRDKEKSLANMVIAAYNSPEIIIAKQASSVTEGSGTFIYRNALIHGSNGSVIAEELFDMKLYH